MLVLKGFRSCLSQQTCIGDWAGFVCLLWKWIIVAYLSIIIIFFFSPTSPISLLPSNKCLPESPAFILLGVDASLSSSTTHLLRNIMWSAGQGWLIQWKSGSAALHELIGCPDSKQTEPEPADQGLGVGLSACWIVLVQYRPCSVLTSPRRIQRDQQGLRLYHFLTHSPMI